MRRIARVLDWLLPIGPRSVLFGAHQFLLHPIFVWVAWWKLYGFPRDPRLYVAFAVHDLGYFTGWTHSMDGPDGEEHVWFGACVMHWLFDGSAPATREEAGDPHVYYDMRRGWRRRDWTWGDFCLYHSRFWAKRHGRPFSRLCVADKLAAALEPWWLYLPRVWLSGELREYMALAGPTPGGQPEGSKYKGEPVVTSDEELRGLSPARAWHRRMANFCRKWAMEHRDGRTDTWTQEPAEAPALSPEQAEAFRRDLDAKHRGGGFDQLLSGGHTP